ncbi:MAG TPA: S-methyl-5-thioribose-1-phosphate isomerase [Nitrosopumilus sp.]|jgi:methylthioribose-1-phosphate isomerase|nr:S-methyl-5-thioribose-1-phosphate isomerase [Nitrosopumilus sp.]
MSDNSNIVLRTVEWKNDKVVMIDQTKLPNELIFVEFDDFNQVADAISSLVVRGAPAIGVSGAFGLALAVLQSKAITREELLSDLQIAREILFATRPTAVNLGWALEKIMNVAKTGETVEKIQQLVISTAKRMADEDIEINKSMGKNGSVLFDDNDTIMTHCNAGSLATVAYGTALGVIRATRESGKNVKVIATETRPIQQGSRLTAFELKHDGFDVSLIPDTAVGYSMANGLVNKVVVGADRIVKTGHVFNKIGTYQVATMAKQHGIPFYVAAPLSTIDLETKADDVIIEMRKGSEVTGIGEKKTAPDDIGVINPAFDMTPPELIAGIITEKGVATAPYEESIQKLFQAN